MSMDEYDPLLAAYNNGNGDQTGTTEVRDQQRMRWKARELSREFHGRIVNEAQCLDVPTIKYFRQYLLEEVIADMESFV